MKRVAVVALSVLVIVVILNVVLAYKADLKPGQEVKALVKAELRDPESAQFSEVYQVEETKLRCGLVNAKNGYGGYDGGRRFVVSPLDEVILEPEDASKSEPLVIQERQLKLMAMFKQVFKGCMKNGRKLLI